MGSRTSVGFSADITPLIDIMGSSQRFKTPKTTALMEAIARYKPWTMKPGEEQKRFYETYAKYEPPLTRHWFRGENPEYLIPPAKGGLSPLKTSYIEPEGGVYFEEPASSPVWTEKDLGEVRALADKLYGPGESEEKTDFVRAKFGGSRERKFASETAAEREAAAEADIERALGENPEIESIEDILEKYKTLLTKVKPEHRATARKTLGPRTEREFTIRETQRANKEREAAKKRGEDILKDREKRLAEDMKFRQGLAKVKENRLAESAKVAKAAKTTDAALKAADVAYQNYLKEYRWELSENNKLQEQFFNRARVVGDTEFRPEYRNPAKEQPMRFRDWLDSDEGYPYLQRIRELGGIKEEGVTEGNIPSPPVVRKEQDKAKKFSEKHGIILEP